MKRWHGAALFLAMALLFLIANRGAYEGYFADDELDNLSWAPAVPLSDFAAALVSPRFQPGNFRPAGHLYFRLAGPAFGMDFSQYVIPIHAIHLLNVWLVWLLVRRLGASPFAAASGAVLFAFHMAVFDVLWKPMYVFDLLCATFSLTSLLLWIDGRVVLSFAAFWLAYKSKEPAVMLPFVLACYEYWLGKRRWKPLAPFAAASFSFGIQGLLLNPHRGGDYAFQFSARELWRSITYYRDRILLVPHGGVVLAALPALFRDRRVWFGTAALALFFLPLLPLSGRLFGAYCYLPLAGAAVAFAAIADRGHRGFVALFLVAWLFFNFIHLRLNRRQALAVAEENRRYVAAIMDFARRAPEMRQFICDGRPFALHSWGIEGALRWVYGRQDLLVAGVEDPAARTALRSQRPVAILSWDPALRTLAITARDRNTPDAPYIKMDRFTPVWQLEEGWYQLEGGYRWTGPTATARLSRPADARQFALTVYMPQDVIRGAGGSAVQVRLDGEPLPEQHFTEPGWQTARWELPPGAAGTVTVRLASPPYRPQRDPRALGLAVGGFGFK